MTKREIRITSRDEYGNPFILVMELPAFFQNRDYARFEKIELIDYDEKRDGFDLHADILQTIEESKKKIETHNAFQKILTMRDLKK